MVVQEHYDSPRNNDHILASSLKMLGSGGKKTLGGVNGSNDMGLLTSCGGGRGKEQMGFSGVLGTASRVADGEGADDDSASNDEN